LPVWTWLRQQQQRGAQLPPREAVKDRAAQKNDEADQQVSGETAAEPVYPAGRLEDQPGDNTPSAPDPHVNWDEVVQPERAPEQEDDLPLPEGK
jgi:hypothetical protein